MKKISRNRFNAFLDFVRNPMICCISEEIAWYENESHTILGTIAHDFTDSDYSVVIFGRDEARIMRAFNVEVSFVTIEDAEKWMFAKVKKIEKTGQTEFPQGVSIKGCDLFTPVVKEEKMSLDFKAIKETRAHSAARGLISEIAPYFYDVDGNFVEQFQTQGFDSR